MREIPYNGRVFLWNVRFITNGVELCIITIFAMIIEQIGGKRLQIKQIPLIKIVKTMYNLLPRFVPLYYITIHKL